MHRNRPDLADRTGAAVGLVCGSAAHCRYPTTDSTRNWRPSTLTTNVGPRSLKQQVCRSTN